jgi:hypothetical protein
MIRKRKPHEQHRDGGLSATARGGEVRSGLLASRASWRGAVVLSAGSEWSDAAAAVDPVVDEGKDSAGRGRSRGYLWAELMRRTFETDVLTCPRCGGRLRLVALIEQASVVQRILRHLGPPTEVPEPRAARAPPGDSRR